MHNYQSVIVSVNSVSELSADGVRVATRELVNLYNVSGNRDAFGGSQLAEMFAKLRCYRKKVLDRYWDSSLQHLV